jgi:hypothetical protein
MTHKRLTNSDYDANTLFNHGKYLSPGLAKIIKDLDFYLFIEGITTEQYVETVMNFSIKYPGFAPAYRDWCINFSFRKHLQWRFEVEPEFNNYQYLTDTIIQEIEFTYFLQVLITKIKPLRHLKYIFKNL